MGVLELLEVEQAQLAQLLGGHVGFAVEVEYLDVAVDELEDAGDGEVELQGVQNVDLHIEHVVFGLGLVGDLHEVAHLRGLDFLVLGADQHAGDSDQLQLAPVHVLLREIAVDRADRHLECFGQQLELEVHLDQPVHKNAPHLLVHVALVLHLAGVGLELTFGLEAVFMHVFGLERAVEGVPGLLEVHPGEFGFEVYGLDY